MKQTLRTGIISFFVVFSLLFGIGAHAQNSGGVKNQKAQVKKEQQIVKKELKQNKQMTKKGAAQKKQAMKKFPKP